MSATAMTNAELDALALKADARHGERMMSAVYSFLGRFVCYPTEDAQVAHTLWCAHAHLMSHWESTPRLAFLSAEPASGKTRALEITELLVPNPVATVNVTPAYLFRKVGAEQGATILFDEIDTVFGPKAKDNEDIRGLLNAGHRRGAKTGRCVVRGKTVETEEITAYAAVALAGLGWLPDTILSRSVIVRMKRRRPDQKVEAYRRRIHAPQGDLIRQEIEIWATNAQPEWPDMPAQIQDRDADVWEPLLAVADAIGGEWPERARRAAVSFVSASKDIEPSLGVRLLADIRVVFGNLDVMTSRDLLAELVKLEESPWGDLYGKELDQRGLAKRLREYEIKPCVIRMASGTFRGYRRSDFKEAWDSYLSTGRGEGEDGTEHLPSNPAEAKQTKQVKRGGVVSAVSAVSHSTADTGAEGDEKDADGWQFNREPVDLSIPDFLDRRLVKTAAAGGY